MSMSLPSIGALDRALAEAKQHPNGRPLAALCFDVLSAQAEARGLKSGRRVVRVRSSALRLMRTQAETAEGNLLTLLERGPERTAQWALIGAFAVRGLDDRLEEASAAERREILERFARHADWLELSTSYAPYRFVKGLLAEEHQDALIEALEGVVLAPSDGPSLAAHRARAMLRVHVLTTLDRPGARVALARLAESTADSWIRTLAQHALGTESLPTIDGFEVKGSWGRVPRISVLRVLSYFVGIALLQAVGRTLAYGFGLERTGRVRLEANALHVRRETRLFGRTLRVSDASYALRDVACALREVSMPAFQVLFGALALAVGVVLGVIKLSDAIARGDRALLISAALALGVGALLDLGLAGWGRLRRDRAGFELVVDHERVVALRRVDPERAQRLVEQIARRKA
ncbi:MAG: hypothetical protein JWN04_3706 [Myxococcaceae bacterium]|nr:hypothetical protein [Myxococcaceae bacterium]